MNTTERRLYLLNKVIVASKMYPGLSFTSTPYGVPDQYDAVNFYLAGALFTALYHMDGRVSVEVVQDTENGQAKGIRTTTKHLASIIQGSLDAHLNGKEHVAS